MLLTWILAAVVSGPVAGTEGHVAQSGAGSRDEAGERPGMRAVTLARALALSAALWLAIGGAGFLVAREHRAMLSVAVSSYHQLRGAVLGPAGRPNFDGPTQQTSELEPRSV